MQNQKDKENKRLQQIELIRKKNKERINQAFSNRKNRKVATKIAEKVAEKKGKELSEEDIKKIKIKIISGRDRK